VSSNVHHTLAVFTQRHASGQGQRLQVWVSGYLERLCILCVCVCVCVSAAEQLNSLFIQF